MLVTTSRSPATSTRQAEIAAWFDRTYRRRGLRYVRPPDAYPIFLQLAGARPGERLLDVACGPGLLLEAARARGLVATGVDLSGAALRLARAESPAAALFQANAEALPFDDASFDVVTCLGSLERMLDRERALAEMRRVAAPGARFCFLVRNADRPSWRLWHLGLGRRNRTANQDACSLEAWRDLFERGGLRVVSVHPDQWGRQRLRRLLRGRPDPTRPEPVARPLLPLRWALEFVFVLREPEGGCDA